MNENILIIEDEALIALSLKEKIQELGYNVSGIFDNGEEAVNEIHRHLSTLDLILMDIGLKGEYDGIETAQHIRTIKNTIPIIFLTGHTNENTLSRAKSFSPEAFLLKSIDDYNLQITLDLILSKNKKDKKTLSDNMLTRKSYLREMDEFTMMMSHDLKAPLRGIVNIVKWLNIDLPDLNEDNKKKLSLISGQIEKMEFLIDGLIEYSKVGKENIRSQEIDLYSLINGVVISLSISNNIEINVDPNLPTINSSKLLITQLFTNLISNAIMHNDKTDIVIAISYNRTEQGHQVCVADNGPGIPESMKQRVFKLFYSTKGKKNQGGSGIGLFIVKKIISELKSSISIRDNKPNGTMFQIDFDTRIDRSD